MDKLYYFKKFKEKSIGKFKDQFDFSEFNYINNITKGIIICKDHGRLSVKPCNHLTQRFGGCDECELFYYFCKFKEKSIEKFKDRFDFSEFNYIDGRTKGILRCKEHNLKFKITPKLHIEQRFGGCDDCRVDNRRVKQLNKFKEKSIEKFKDQFDFSEFNYIDDRTKGILRCKEHGKISISLSQHTMQRFGGCDKCCDRKHKQKYFDIFVKKATAIHGNKYQYYINYYMGETINMKIFCKTCQRWFFQLPNNHTAGKGCCKCGNNISKPEQEIYKYIKSIYTGKIIQSDRTVLKGRELDIYLPELNIAFEYNGLYWHSEVNGKCQNYHLDKTKQCNKLGIQLLHIWSYENMDIWKSKIKVLLGLAKRIYARKCKIEIVDNVKYKEFCIKNHLQGYTQAKHKLGLFYKNKLVAVMSFSKPRFNKKYTWELIRFCSLKNHVIVGGFSRLLKHFRKNWYGSILTYANRDYSHGDVYSKYFKLAGYTKPNYIWVKGDIIFPRYQTQKHKLHKLLKDKFNANKTEKENMESSGFNRCWDTGNLIFICKRLDKLER